MKLRSFAVLPLIRMLFDITLLRSGPEDIPRSWLMLYLCIGLWVLGLVITTVLIENFNTAEAWVGLASWVLGLVCYVFILILMGHSNRSLQTIAAIAGAGAIISFAMLAELVLLTPILGSDLANFGAVLILFWSVPVKGHIIARAIERHWYIGIVFATSIFALQFAFTSTLTLER